VQFIFDLDNALVARQDVLNRKHYKTKAMVGIDKVLKNNLRYFRKCSIS
jgi:hypothetical protein